MQWSPTRQTHDKIPGCATKELIHDAATAAAELVESILLRIPADDPGSLVRAGVVSKLWRRLISGAAFRRRFRELHRTAPLLGVLCNRRNYPHDHDRGSVCSTERSVSASFFPTSSFRPARPRLDLYGWRVVDARHGHVLLGREPIPPGIVGWRIDLAVWDPITDDWQPLPPPPPVPSCQQVCSWNAAVLCPVGAGGGCDHLDCRGGSFLVVFMGVLHDKRSMLSCIYTSEARAWSKAVATAMHRSLWFYREPSHLTANTTLHFFNHEAMGIVNYDLTTGQVSVNEMHFDPPSGVYYPDEMVLMTAEDGSLGFASTARTGRLYLWSREKDLLEGGSGGVARFVRSRVIDLRKLIPDGPYECCRLKGLADGIGVFFMWTFYGIYSLNILSGEVTELPNNYAYYEYRVVPYLSFHTPALEAVSTCETTTAGSSSVSRTQVVGPRS